MTLDERGARVANALRRELDQVAVPDAPSLGAHPGAHRAALVALTLFVVVMFAATSLAVRGRFQTDGRDESFAGESTPTDAAGPSTSGPDASSPAPSAASPLELLVTPPNRAPYAVYVDDTARVTQTFDLYFPGSTVTAFVTDAPTHEAVGWLCTLGPCDSREIDTTRSGHIRTWWAIAGWAKNESIVSVSGAGWTFVAQGPVRDLEQFTATLTITSGTELSITAEGPLQPSPDSVPNGLGRLRFERSGAEPAVYDIVADCHLDATYTCFGQAGARSIQGDAPDAYLRQP